MAPQRTKTESAPAPFTDRQVKVGNAVIKLMSRTNTWVYRVTNGKLGGRFRGGAPVCLVTTTGRRTGKPRTVPLLYMRDGSDVVIVASKGGMPRHPEWYLNIQADSGVEIEVGAEKGRYVARTADPQTRERLWSDLTTMYSDFDSYQSRADRVIPVIVCSPA